MPDVHARLPPQGPLGIQRVGLRGIRKPIHVLRPGREVVLAAEFSAAVDLPPDRKGSDLSRNAEAIAEITERTALQPVRSLEEACATIAEDLLRRHTSASEALVVASAEYFVRQGIGPGRESYEDFLLVAEAVARRLGTDAVSVRRSIGLEAVGMTACPCAMESCRELLEGELGGPERSVLETIPGITHNQRSRTRLVFEISGPVEVEVDQMLTAITEAHSAPTFAILKRGDEARLVLRAHRSPRFAEDVVRELLAGVPARFPQLPDDAVVRAETVSEESIHKYDVHASHWVTMADLRRLVTSP
ncbi:MAG: GTP cyclohydrolase MptA [Thermoplasmata archaeon]